MRMLWASARIVWKRICRDKALLAVWLLCWCGLLAGAYQLSDPGGALEVRCGVVYDPADGPSRELAARIPRREFLRLSFYSPGQLEEVERLVATGALECAYYIREGWAEQAGAPVVLLKSPRSVADPILSEIISAALLDWESPRLAARELQAIYGGDEGELLEWMEAAIAGYEGYRFVAQEAVAIGEAEAPYRPEPAGKRLLHGLTALLVLLFVFWTTPRFLADKKVGWQRRLTTGRRLLYYLGMWLALWLAGVLAGGLSVLAVRLGNPAAWAGWAWELGYLALYGAAVSVTAVLAALVLPDTAVVYGVGMLLLLFVLAFGGILADWREISPFLWHISELLLPYRYLQGILEGSPGGIWFPAALCLGGGAAGALLIAGEGRTGGR